jgi:23S rRNA-/tRNA-specific pseudouridylate synthase
MRVTSVTFSVVVWIIIVALRFETGRINQLRVPFSMHQHTIDHESFFSVIFASKKHALVDF